MPSDKWRDLLARLLANASAPPRDSSKRRKSERCTATRLAAPSARDVHRASAGWCVPNDTVDFMAVPRSRGDPGDHDLLPVAGWPQLRFHGEATTIEMVKAVDVGCGGVATERRSQLVWGQRGPRQTHRRAETGVEVEDGVDHGRQHIVSMTNRRAWAGATAAAATTATFAICFARPLRVYRVSRRSSSSPH
jgi:hypothetical protein